LHSPGISSWLKLIHADRVGPVIFRKLLAHFGSPDAVLASSAAELSRVEGVGPHTAEYIAKSMAMFDPAPELLLADKLGVSIIHLEDDRYPLALKQIYDPPPVLYVKGTLIRQDGLAIAIVGTRRCSLYGQEQASRFAHLLASAGFTIVSGMARGIDTAAHHGALAASGRTIAVQGAGLANPYPPENRNLFDLISSAGACISELPLTCPPQADNFPPRNRIIAGLALGVIIVEAPMNSGALITASAALEYSREVMAVPGKIDSPLSRGTHRLIKQGAKLVETVEDVMEALGCFDQDMQEHASTAARQATQKIYTPSLEPSQLNLSTDEKTIYDCLTTEPQHIDEIITCAELPAGSINATLILLQLKGLVKQLPGNFFRKN
jgi:DNA processing protein